MARDPETDRAVLALANLHRCGRRPTNAQVSAAKADIATAKMHAFIERTLAEAPPLRDEQRARLVRLLMRDGAR